MEEIKIWKLSADPLAKSKALPLETVAETTTEQLLEDVLTASPEVLMPNLRIIGRQTETPGGPLDLLGVDEDGRLVVFELKRGNLTRDAVAQAIDYASFLADLEIEPLCQHLAATSGNSGSEHIDDFAQWYQTNFQRSVSDIGRPKIVLVGLSVDERTKRMVRFLAQAELDISLLTFHGFTHEGNTLLARQVEVKAKEATISVKSTKLNNQAKLDQLLSNLALKQQYEAISSLIRGAFGDSAYQWPNATGYSYYLQELTANGDPTNRAYLAILLSEKQKSNFQLLLQARAIEAIGEAQLQNFASAVGSKAVLKPSGYAEIWMDAQKSATVYAPAVTSLVQAIVAGWKEKMKVNAKAEAAEAKDDA